jgi:hypothetical protein
MNASFTSKALKDLLGGFSKGCFEAAAQALWRKDGKLTSNMGVYL